LGIQGGDWDGISGIGDNGLKVLEEETTMESVGTLLDEVAGRQLVGTLDTDASKAGMGDERIYVENEGGLESGVVTVGMTEEETIGLHGIRCEEQAADSSDEEEVGAFEDGWAGMATFG
jgi:hypothetical protein